MRRNAATILLFAAALALAAAAFIVLTGGVAGSMLTLRDARRPALAAVALFVLACAVVRREDRGAVFHPYLGAAGTRAARVTLVTSLAVLVFALAWSSRAAGGSDSSCYVLQAEALAHGQATLSNPVATTLGDAPNAVFAPTGFVPSRRQHGGAVPICAPGLALAMAAADLVRPSAVFLVVPITASLLVWLTFIYGRRVDDDVTGVCAAVLLACSPIFLYQAVQPMSDVPAAAAWMAAVVVASPIATGLWASVAILIRPNLALLVVPLALLHTKRGQPPFFAKNGDSRGWRRFVLGLAPGAVILLALNAARYGSPLATGYGSAEALFTRAHVPANLLRYPRWLLQTETPLLLLALAAPWVLRRDPARARLAWMSLIAAALLVATYLAYTVFDDWWYIRFLLPALPMLLAMSVAVLRRLAAPLGAVAARMAVAAVVVVCGLWFIRGALARHVTELQALESRFRLAGEYAARALPANAVVLAVQESGSVRFHGHRDTIAWDAIPAEALDAYVTRLRAAGRASFIVLEDDEEARFRLRFAGQHNNGGLDWRPLVEIRAPVRVRFYETVVARMAGTR